MKTGFCISIILIALVGFSCEDISTNTLKHDASQFDTIIYTTASGWTGWSKTCTLYSDKRMICKEHGGILAHKDTTISSAISSQQLDSLNTLIKNIDIQSLSNRFECQVNCPTDLPLSSITFKTTTDTKEIVIIQPVTLPEGLSKIINLIAQWDLSIQ
jgi:hypothetical protein